MTGGLSTNFHGVGIGPLSNILAVKSIKNYENKNNAWNIRCLVDELFVPSTQPANISYRRLSDFKT